MFPARAQEARGTILGRITDSSGAVIPAVQIKITNEETNVAIPVVSNEQGNYFDNVSTGSFDFSTTYTRGPLDNSTAAPMGQGLAFMLLGMVTGGYVERHASNAEQSAAWSVFLQDDWKLTRKLALNLGLRYELESPMTERFDRSVRGFDPNVVLPINDAARAAYARNSTPEVPLDRFVVRGGVNFAGADGQPRGLWDADKNNLMPRLGFAYRMAPRTVLRGGYGVFFGFLGTRRGDVLQYGFS